MADDLSDELTRAEDILLGTHGFGEDAQLTELHVLADGYFGKGIWPCGEEFEFTSDNELDELERWAVEILVEANSKERNC